ncbi:MAG TPA: AAA family ATPase [Nocardioides sp.]|nr:AAA family ATPase [Nocardioides sp.]
MSVGELLMITGPPAVGKMTVGRAVCERTDFRLFHNHHTIEPLLEIFGYGTDPFVTLNGEFRRRVIEEAAAAGTRLIFTYVWAFELDEEAAWVRRLIAPYVEAGLRVSFVELYADLPTRLERNIGEIRIADKRSKRDLAWSEANVREMDASYVMNSDPDRPTPADEVLADFAHLRLDNSGLTPEEAAAEIVAWLDDRN